VASTHLSERRAGGLGCAPSKPPKRSRGTWQEASPRYRVGSGASVRALPGGSYSVWKRPEEWVGPGSGTGVILRLKGQAGNMPGLGKEGALESGLPEEKPGTQST
jgi:hypothetical protein